MYGLRDTSFPKKRQKRLKIYSHWFLRIDRQTDGDRQRDSWTDGWTDGQMDGRTDGRMDRRMETGMYGLRDTPFPKKRQKKLEKSTPIGFSDGWMDGRTDGRTD